MKNHPDIVATVRFYTTQEGGRSNSTPPILFKCPLEFEGEKFDCGLHLEESGPLAPGASATIPITLVFPRLIKPRLKIGSQFTLWELKIIAEGVVNSILPD
jgi:hypothetical protein